MKLARKIIALATGAFLLVLAVLGYTEAKRAIRDYHASVARQLATTGRALRAPLAEVLDVEKEPRAVELVEKADRDSKEMEIHWIPLPSTSSNLAPDTQKRLMAGEEVTVESGAGANGRLTVYVPVEPNSALEVSRSLGDERAVVLEIVRDRALTGALALLAAAVLVLFAGVAIVGEPMRELAAHARRIGAGDLSRRLPEGRRDEIGELAREMNGMCDQLASARSRLAEEAEAKLRATEQLRHADRLRTVGTLASGIAHEIGTPLAVIGGRAKMLASGTTAREDVVAYAGVIARQVERITKIMRTLLDFSRRSAPAKTRTNVHDVVRSTLELLAPFAKQRDVVLEVRSSGEPPLVDADPTQLEQAVANLVVNGLQAIEGGGTVEVALEHARATPPGETEARPFVRVTVRDDGAGIAPEDLPRVFEPFFTTKDVGEGTGLGLSVTYGIVRDHGGFVDVESKLGAGTAFSLFLPE